MPFLDEPLSGGLVQTKPAHRMEVGELQLTDNCMYRHDSVGLWGAQGRVITAVTGVDCVGLVIAKFDNGTAYWIYQNPTSTLLSGYEIPTGNTAFTLNSYTQGDTLSAAVFNNQYFIFNGAHANQVIRGTVLSAHGLDEVDTAPGITTVTSGGSWPLGSAGLDKFYEYWVTESAVVNGVTVESSTAATAVATSDLIVTTAYRVLIVPPPVKNAGATHYNVYRSTGKAFKSEKQFPIGVLIATVPIAAGAQYYDGSAAVTSYVFPSSASGADWANPTNITADDGANATDTVPANTTSTLTASSFAFAAVADSISGIEVALEASVSVLGTGGGFRVQISLDGGTTYSAARTAPIGTGITAITLGGQNDPWGLAVPTAAALSLFIKLVAVGAPVGSLAFAVDYVKARVHHTSVQSVGVVAFPAIIIELAGQTFAVAANGKPPTASTGDVINGILVTNDIANPSHVRWSLAGKPHAFPSLYFDDVETADNDQVKCVKRCGQRIAVGMSGAMFRYDYMPSEDDATFNTGAARVEVDPSFGIVGPNAACVFVGPDGRPMLAFMSLDGLRGSDLFTTWPLCPDVDWRAILTPISALNRISIVNNPRNYELIVYYPGGDVNGLMVKKMFFSYAPAHIKNGRYLKASGPVPTGVAGTEGVTGADCAPGIDVGYSWSVYESWRATGTPVSGDAIWRVVDRATGSATLAAPAFRTRRIFAAGVGTDWNLDAAYLHCDVNAAATLTPTVSGYAADNVTASSALATVAPASAESLVRLFANAGMRSGAVDVKVDCTATADEIRFDSLHLLGRGWGQETEQS